MPVKCEMNMFIHSQISTGMDKQFHPTRYNGCNHSSMPTTVCAKSMLEEKHEENMSVIVVSAVIHHSDVIMSTMASQVKGVSIVYSGAFVHAQMKENIKAPRHWPVRGIYR